VKKIFLILFFIVTTALSLIGCSSEVPTKINLNQLTRVDTIVTNDGRGVMITKENDLKKLKNSLEQIKWEQNVKAEMSRKEDVIATLFMTYDKNMPERLFEYRIWFNEGNGTATFIDSEKNAYGKLDKENTKVLKQFLLP
jgi:hypothetical protein